MQREISKAAVIGAGTMGSGIAAQFANAGIPVLLLDIVPPDAASRNAVAEGAVARQLKSGGFMHPDRARLVTPGNLEDDLARAAEADWIVEAIIEQPEAKRALYAKLEPLRREDTLISSNTSTICLADLTQGRSDGFKQHFGLTHFFNPVRQMRLLELLGAPETSADALERFRLGCDRLLGKTIVECKDTPGFIANRVGIYWMTAAGFEAIRLGLTVEEADAVAGPPFGVPRTGVFGLFDLIGIDLARSIWRTLINALPAADALNAYDPLGDNIFRRLVETGRMGRKSGAGFYRLVRSGEGRGMQVLDLATADYRPEQKPTLDGLAAAGRDLKRLVQMDDKAGRYACRVLMRTIAYAASVAPDIADDVAGIDTAMRLGYAWARGPFELADIVGAGWIAERLAAEGEAVPPLLAAAASAGGFYGADGKTMLGVDGAPRIRPRRPGIVTLADAKEQAPAVIANEGASLWDIGEGVACLELHTKANALRPAVFEMMARAIDQVPRGFRALVIGGEHPSTFSAGADLALFQDGIARGDWQALDAYADFGRATLRDLRFAPFPVVGAAFGTALGGGCEVLLHCNAIVAHAELRAGLPEVSVGLMPGWGGCVQLLARWNARLGADHAQDAAAKVFEVVLLGAPSGAALDARDSGVLAADDIIVMNRDRLLGEARARAVTLAEAGYAPPAEARVTAGGAPGKAALDALAVTWRDAGRITANDAAIAAEIATLLSGGDAAPGAVLTESDLVRLETACFARVLRQPLALERIGSFLANGKPLRN